LLARLAEWRRKALTRTGTSHPIVVIEEAGLDGFWLHRVLQGEGRESHVVDAASIAAPGRSSPRFFGPKGFAALSPTAGGRAPTEASRRRRGGAERSPTSRGCRRPAIRGCARQCFGSTGCGSSISRNRRWRAGIVRAARKRLIVALARKLFVALWKLTSAGVVIEGAAMKTSA
jgi:hypothetical protein